MKNFVRGLCIGATVLGCILLMKVKNPFDGMLDGAFSGGFSDDDSFDDVKKKLQSKHGAVELLND